MFNRQAVLQTLKCGNDQYPTILEEKFPHVLTKILALWGTPELDVYVADLLQPNGRSGGRLDRDGFPPGAAAEIFKLGMLHRKK
ncbi:MAG: hypothetical protein Q7S51_08775 [Gallionellaceae bacterium]|nr:hypothetical protein [Gallionellaceae bacterium]